MVTRLDKDLQVTLIEHMAHLTSADYAEIPQDLLLLGFIPESKADLINDSGIVETLADIYGAWTEGGGRGAHACWDAQADHRLVRENWPITGCLACVDAYSPNPA